MRVTILFQVLASDVSRVSLAVYAHSLRSLHNEVAIGEHGALIYDLEDAHFRSAAASSLTPPSPKKGPDLELESRAGYSGFGLCGPNVRSMDRSRRETADETLTSGVNPSASRKGKTQQNLWAFSRQKSNSAEPAFSGHVLACFFGPLKTLLPVPQWWGRRPGWR